MSKALNRHRFWVCPYFKWDGPLSISCEGGRINFPSKASISRYITQYCAGDDWRKCTVAAALNKYYEEDQKS